MSKRVDSKGFTIIELLLSTSFFTAVMLMVVAGYVQINRSYTRGLTVKEVQNSARLILEDISRAIRDTEPGEIDVTTSPYQMQIGGTCYIWNQEDLTTSNPDGTDRLTARSFNDSVTDIITLVKSTNPNACSGGVNKADSSTQTVVDERIMVQHLGVTQIGSSNSFSINLVVSSTARDEFRADFGNLGDDATCTIQKGDEFCDIAQLETVVTARN